MKHMIFTGAATALVTPFHGDGSIAWDELERLVELQIEGGIDAIVACGTTGEAATMTTEEHTQVIRFIIEKVHGRVPVIAGTGSNDTQFCVELSQEAKELGADGLLLVTPYYNKTSQKGLLESFNYVADSVKMPCILYNVPSRTGCNIQPATYKELSKNPYIVAVKEANGDISATARTAPSVTRCSPPSRSGSLPSRRISAARASMSARAASLEPKQSSRSPLSKMSKSVRSAFW